jgi:hypothetical protein
VSPSHESFLKDVAEVMVRHGAEFVLDLGCYKVSAVSIRFASGASTLDIFDVSDGIRRIREPEASQ